MITVTNSLSGKYFSATIPDVIFSINGYRAAVTMQVDGISIYSEYLYPVSSKIKIGDLCNLITPYAKQSLKITLKVDITEEFTDTTQSTSTSLSADIIYCETDFGDTGAADFIANHYLSTLMGKKVTSQGRLEYLHYIGTEAASVMAYYADGTSGSFTLVPVGGNDKYTTIDVSPSQFVVEGKTLIGFVASSGNRSQEYLIDFDIPDCAPILIFDNSFGVEELLYCTGTATVSPQYKRDSAYIEGKQKNYNIEETRTFKADTGILNFDMANWAMDLFRSRYIRVVNFYKGFPNIGKEIMITEAKPEYTNDDDELPRFTFSYQYAQRNHNVVDLNRAGRIFDNTFDHTFN
jgi:hypothetical protein